MCTTLVEISNGIMETYYILHIVCLALLPFVATSQLPKDANLDLARDDVSIRLIQHVLRLDEKVELLKQENVAERSAMKEHFESQQRELVIQMKAMNQRLVRVETRNRALVAENARLRRQVTNSKAPRDTNARDEYVHDTDGNVEDKDESYITDDKVTVPPTVNSAKMEPTPPDFMTKRQVGQSVYHVAFSAYLDHDVDGLGLGQTVTCNRLLLNDGQGYNNHTGIFTAPLDGVYSFIFFIGERDRHQAIAGLYHNSANMVDAIAQTDSVHDDVQGGNAAILKLKAGDAVYLRSYSGGHVEGSQPMRLTSFSGFLIYPTEEGPVTVVG